MRATTRGIDTLITKMMHALRANLSTRILTGLALGIFTGLFLGEPAANLAPLADVYVRLMQMTVLPYVITALIIAFGQLDATHAKRLAARGGLLLLVVWAFVGAVITVFPLVFPPYENAAFFSSSLVEAPKPFSFPEIYFPANIFESLSRNVVPAVVLFSCLFGVALIGLPEKERLLGPLQVWNSAIVRMTKFVLELTPVGVFSIGAVAAGTLDLDTVAQIQIYIVAFAAASLLLAFVVLPLLVTAVTPFRYLEVVGIARDALVTAFVTSNAFIVLPLLVERTKVLLERHGLLNDQTDSAAELMAPVMFNFPNAGKLLTLLFVPFTAWMSGAPLLGADYPTLFAAGIPSYFAKAQVALPFLLDVFSLPQDSFQLYMPTTIVTGKFDSLVTAVNLLVFALLGAAAMGGFLVLEAKRILRASVIIVAVTSVTVSGLRAVIAATVDTEYHLTEAVHHMHELEHHADSIVYKRGQAVTSDTPATVPSSLARIKARGTLRFGYDPDNLPFSFFNAEGQLVGFDVEMSKRLAEALGVKAEFIPVEWPKVPAMLDSGRIDLMPGIWIRPYWRTSVRISQPYLVGTMALVTLDERRHEFAQVDAIRKRRGLRIGVPLDANQVETSARHYFGDSDVTFVPIEFWKPFFEGRHPEMDAFLMPAEHASGWSLLHPAFSVVVPQPNPIRIPSGFGMSSAADDLANVVNEWILFATNAGIVQRAYDHWVLGRGAKQHTARWSIMRDVLHWGQRATH